MKELKNTLEQLLSFHLGSLKIEDLQTLSGGCINQAFKIKTRDGLYFIKLNKAMGHEMFEAEAKGLRLLHGMSCITVPEVIASGNTADFAYLILTFIDSGIQTGDYWEDFGKKLAYLHENTNDFFGLDHTNFIGSFPQINKQERDWVSFFVNQRLTFQIKLARDSGRISSALIEKFERLFSHLKEILVIEKPSLLHGDLWSGNVMKDQKGKAALVDPAVYYGNREMDLAFTNLFGGFDKRFYNSYQETFPLDPGYEERFDIYNLYPLMVHVNLFGGGYLQSVSSILARYS